MSLTYLIGTLLFHLPRLSESQEMGEEWETHLAAVGVGEAESAPKGRQTVCLGCGAGGWGSSGGTPSTPAPLPLSLFWN